MQRHRNVPLSPTRLFCMHSASPKLEYLKVNEGLIVINAREKATAAAPKSSLPPHLMTLSHFVRTPSCTSTVVVVRRKGGERVCASPSVRFFLPFCVFWSCPSLSDSLSRLLLLFLPERVESHSRNLCQCSNHGCTSNKWHSEALSTATLHTGEDDILASGGLPIFITC